MKALHTYATYVPDLTEGISRNIHDLTKALDAHGVDGVIDARGTPIEELNHRRLLLRQGWDAHARAVRARRDPSIDVVHFHASLPSTALFAALARARTPRARSRLLVHLWNAFMDVGRELPAALRHDALTQRLANGPMPAALGLLGCPEIIVSSRLQADQLARIGYSGRLHVIPNGVDTNRIRPATATQREDARRHFSLTGEPVILYYGHVSPWKGVDVLIDALPGVLARHRNAQVLLSTTSYGAARARLHERIERAGVRDRIVHVGPSDVPTLHAAADIAVLPTRASVGTALHPNVLLECLAAGLPVIAAATGSIPEVVEDGRNGRLFPPGDAELLAQTLSETIADEAARRRLGRSARDTATRTFDWSLIAARVATAYRSPGRAPRATETPGGQRRPLPGPAQRGVP